MVKAVITGFHASITCFCSYSCCMSGDKRQTTLPRHHEPIACPLHSLSVKCVIWLQGEGTIPDETHYTPKALPEVLQFMFVMCSCVSAERYGVAEYLCNLFLTTLFVERTKWSKRF